MKLGFRPGGGCGRMGKGKEKEMITTCDSQVYQIEYTLEGCPGAGGNAYYIFFLWESTQNIGSQYTLVFVPKDLIEIVAHCFVTD